MALPLFHFNVDSVQILNSYELLSKERNESTVFAVLDCIAFFLTVFALFAFSCVFIRRSQTSHWMEVCKTKIANCHVTRYFCAKFFLSVLVSVLFAAMCRP